MPTFAEWFIAERAAKNFSSTREFARASGVSRSTITEIEQGRGFGFRQAKTKAKIAKALNYTAIELQLKEIELDGAEVAEKKSSLSREGKTKVYLPDAIYDDLKPLAKRRKITVEQLIADVAKTAAKLPHSSGAESGLVQSVRGKKRKDRNHDRQHA